MNKIIILFTLFYWGINNYGFAQKTKKPTKPVYLQYIADNETLPTLTANKFERFKQQIMGHFSNQKQVIANPELGDKHQEFIVIPVFQERPNEFWIYLEYFAPATHDAPVDQRIEQYVRVNRDTIRMEVYYLKDITKYINEWKKAEPFKGLTKNDLIRDPSCDLLIVQDPEKPNAYKTLMPESIDCSLKVVQGRSRFIVLSFDLSDWGYSMRFQFYDKNLIKVNEANWMKFERLDYKAPDYHNYAPNVKPAKHKKPQ